MNILNRTQEIRDKTRSYGRYRFVADKSNVSYEWLCKFAVGKIINPTVENVYKLEQFFLNIEIEEINSASTNWYLENNRINPDRRSNSDRRKAIPK